MGGISSINFKKSVDYQVFHNSTIRPSYIIGGELECDPPKGYDALNLKNQIIENAKQAYKVNCKARNKEFQATNYAWSAVCNIKAETTMDDLKKLAEHFNKKYGFQCYQIAIHRDEGHINDDGEKVINHHAHLEFITLSKENGKQLFKLRDFNPQKMREIQTEVAEILQMERGQDKRISGAKRVEPRAYAKMKEQERANQKALKNELETIKKELESVKTELKNAKKEKNLSKTAIKSAIKTAKVAWRNENSKRIEQGLAPIYTATHYNSSEYLKGLENRTYKNNDEFLKALDELQKRIFKEYEQGKNATHGISIKSSFKSKLIDDNYSDLSRFLMIKDIYHNFYFDNDKKTLENKKQGYKIKDFGNTLQLNTSNNQSLAEQVEIMLKMAQGKGWELDKVKISGSQAFCDEVARQMAEIKAKERAEQERKIKAETQAQAQKIADLENKNIDLQGLTQTYKDLYESRKNGTELDKLKAENLAQAQKIADLEKSNAELKAELANKTQETALKTQNDPKPSQDINQSKKTQQNAPLSQSQEFLEIVKKLDKMPFWHNEQIADINAICKYCNINKKFLSLSSDEKVKSDYTLTRDLLDALNKKIEQEKQQLKTQEPQQKPISDDELRRQYQLEQIAKLKKQGHFDLNSTNSQSKDKGIEL